MGLCHSLIEDTILMMALGGHYSGILLARILFSFIFIWLLVKFTQKMNDFKFSKYFLSNENHKLLSLKTKK